MKISIKDARQEALDKGHKEFTIDQPCTHGHLSPRFTRNGGCIECNRIITKKWRDSNKDATREYMKEYMHKYYYTINGRARMNKASKRWEDKQKLKDNS